MTNKKGLTLIEIIIAVLILSYGMASSLKLYTALTEILSTSTYYYTAVNLARDVLEFGEAASFSHDFKMWYKYPPGKKDYGWGVIKTTGYALKEWQHYLPKSLDPQKYPEPFYLLGDIKKNGLVPSQYPNSVEIYYECKQEPLFRNKNGSPAFREDVTITWQSRNGEIEKLEASVIPIVSNNQLTLEIQDFWWK
ncbi:MAG: prepilin-type N-terminal cleavage/methylation domain-containing protein [Candidatus Omnitrophota bacterium]